MSNADDMLTNLAKVSTTDLARRLDVLVNRGWVPQQASETRDDFLYRQYEFGRVARELKKRSA